MANASARTMLYLTRADVKRLLPPVVEQIDLIERTYLAMAAGRVELPPKPGIHPRKDAFIHAMPAYLTDDDAAGIKWVSGYPDNRSLGLPYISGLIVLNEATTGMPTAVMDAAEITAARTAAASGVCIRRWAPAGWRRIAIIGCGEQGIYHAVMARALNADVVISAYDPDPARSHSLPGNVEVCTDVAEAVEGAEVVVTAAPITTSPTPTVMLDMLSEQHLVLPIDFDATVDGSVVTEAELFMSDDLGQFRYYREHGHFGSWPQARESVGEELTREVTASRIVCCNLGVGAVDIAFANQIIRGASGFDGATRLPL